MTSFLKVRRVLLILYALTIAAACIYALFAWSYYLLPWKHSYDHRWRDMHSRKALRQETQKAMNRLGWQAACCWDIGEDGDTSDVAWLMERLKPGDTLGCGGTFLHAGNSLRWMTNQDIGDKADSWLAWWTTNKDKSQEDWIREGFLRYGIELAQPLSESNVASLIQLLGSTSTPQSVQYNAYRWLRDSDFPSEYLLPVRDDDLYQQGFARYHAYLKKEFEGDERGRLSLLPTKPSGAPWRYSSKVFRAWFSGFVFELFFLPRGILLVALYGISVWFACRADTRNVLACAVLYFLAGQLFLVARIPWWFAAISYGGPPRPSSYNVFELCFCAGCILLPMIPLLVFAVWHRIRKGDFRMPAGSFALLISSVDIILFVLFVTALIG